MPNFAILGPFFSPTQWSYIENSQNLQFSKYPSTRASTHKTFPSSHFTPKLNTHIIWPAAPRISGHFLAKQINSKCLKYSLFVFRFSHVIISIVTWIYSANLGYYNPVIHASNIFLKHPRKINDSNFRDIYIYNILLVLLVELLVLLVLFILF